MVDERAWNTVGMLFPFGGKPDGGRAENPVRSERKQRYWLLSGVRFPLKGAFFGTRLFYWDNKTSSIIQLPFFLKLTEEKRACRSLDKPLILFIGIA